MEMLESIISLGPIPIISGVISASIVLGFNHLWKKCLGRKQKGFLRDMIVNERNEIFPHGNYSRLDIHRDYSILYKRFVEELNVINLHRSNYLNYEESYPVIYLIQDAMANSFPANKNTSNIPITNNIYIDNYKVIFTELEKIEWLKLKKYQ